MTETHTERKDSPKGRRGVHTRNARRRSRELALQGLYQYFINPSEIGEIDSQIREAPGFDKADFDHYQALLIGSIHGMAALMGILESKIDRTWQELSPVEKSVLVLGTLELRDCLDIPYRVVINEAVELTKTFGGTEAHRFVNGVLDKVALETRSAETGSGLA